MGYVMAGIGLVAVCVLLMAAGLCRAAAQDERDQAEADRLPWRDR